MTREDIEEAARKESGIWAPGPVHLQDIYRRDDFEAGFCVGAEWRINSVWHDSKEKPVLNEFFVYQTDNGEWETDCLLKDRWDLYVVSTKLIRWAYMKDLIPDKEE